MTENGNAKPLTEAEIRHLATFNAAFLQAKANLDRFVAFLREQHDAPAPDWMLRNLQVGFEKEVSPSQRESRKRVRREKGADAVNA